MGSQSRLLQPNIHLCAMFTFVLLACLLAVAVEGSYYGGYDGYGGYGGYGYGGYGYGGYGYGGYGHGGYGYGGYGDYGYPYYGGYGYGHDYGYGHGYGYGGYGSKLYKRSTVHQQVHVSGNYGQPTVVPTSAYGGYSSYAPAYYGHHASSYAPGYGYSSYAPSHYNYAPYGHDSYYSHGGRYPYSAGSSAYAPGYQSYGYGHQSHGYGNVKYSAGTPFLYNRVHGYY